ncbi:hypothetical protein SASPL_106066 [Salvia splendens]|uniref:DUF7642 domain-containing protein n=1 Tax=Salvia splendens TaxID=180675 RepID=A0A8X9A987_SALSN|nr:uncharacterized protein LOC121765641 [Salvia splendens]XP_042017782.1 uncharacterized protein LOC121765641 [Salvia splendens]KAG6434432.1 hypothetical protein SASPL_106066 [Salvia splendens]
MLMGHAEGLLKLGSDKNLLHSDSGSDLDVDEGADNHPRVLYAASFDELASKHVNYDTIIWLSISLLLVLAWGVGIIMLLYLPYRRYVLQREIASRKLYVTSEGIVYKVSRPSYIPFLANRNVEKHVPLPLIIDVITEQGWLQSLYGLHTFRVESIVHGKAAPVDELQVQGLSNPGFLRKVIITRASKALQDTGISWDPNIKVNSTESMFRMESLTLGPAVLRSPLSKSTKIMGSPRRALMESKGVVPTDAMLNKLEEVNKSVKKLEFLIEKKQGSAGPSQDDA